MDIKCRESLYLRISTGATIFPCYYNKVAVWLTDQVGSHQQESSCNDPDETESDDNVVSNVKAPLKRQKTTNN